MSMEIGIAKFVHAKYQLEQRTSLDCSFGITKVTVKFLSF